jgi:citronellol/citronellal dehydrogenase
MPGGDKLMRKSRKADILGDAAYVILTKPSRDFTGNFCIDDTLLWANGQREFDHYRVDPGMDLMADFFVPEDSPPPVSLKALA